MKRSLITTGLLLLTCIISRHISNLVTDPFLVGWIGGVIGMLIALYNLEK